MTEGRSTRFTAVELSAVLTVGSVGVLIAGLQPQLLGGLAQEGRLSADALGDVATAELLAMGVAAGGAGLLLKAARLQPMAALALVALALLNFATARASGGAILGLRATAGLAEGILVWLTIGTIVRTAHPARWSGVYLLVQTGAQFAVATAFGLWIIPADGSSGGFLALGIVSALAFLALPWLPRRYEPLAEPTTVAASVPARGWIALASVACWLAFVVAVWVYVEPLALQRGLGHREVAVIAPLSLAMQMVGASAATLLAGRWAALPVLFGCAAANVALLAVMGAPGSGGAFVAATAAFGFLWLFAMPFQLPVLMAADPSRRSAELAGGAQLAGASLGPLLASRLVTDRDVSHVLSFGTVALALALLLTIAGVIGRRPLAIR
ncbi:MAG: hypothetical protein AVDCRST_MAG39-576 [uncultured Sphingomonadaceae bacterium]|uniref:Major facilitator superfamily (MFS) profile domain-containing protein n=1 Tax=uncultured Sphingomonadaceae bacterium TaxID=169976 RepID=A0A6J4S331_9SPHN|nr:MAG: hypothetical protein AVDCRST_MAG39-576 [uncultured Sphingomonadaceae bacterium]